MTTVAAIAACAAAAAVIWALLRTRLASRLVAHPSEDRWHEESTPLLGGIGIFAGLSAGLWVAAATGAFAPTRALAGIWVGCAVVFVAGLVDDLRSLGPPAKLAAQLGAAAIVVATGTTVELVDNAAVAAAVAVFWLVAVTNAFNLLDNMDGLAASLAAIAFGFFALDAVTVHPSSLVLAFALAGVGACLGFLPFNLRSRGKALVFMGDSGSQALGFALASIGLLASWRVAGTTAATLILPILVLAVPILDTALVTVVRLLEGRPIHQGGRDHSSHRLVRLGLSEKHAVAVLALIAAGLGLTSLAYSVLDNQRITVIGVLFTVVLLVQFASFLADVESRPADRAASGLSEVFSVHWRRLVEVVADFVLITGAFLAAYVILFGWPGTLEQRYIAGLTLPVVLLARYLAFIPFGLYRSVWRYAGARELLAIAAAVVLSELVALAFMVLTHDLRDFRPSFFVVDALLCTAFVGASRLAERAWMTGLRPMRERGGRRTVVVGAGRTGRSLVRELRETPGERVVGFVDDNPRLRRRRVHGVRVLGSVAELPGVLEEQEPDVVFVTIPNAPRELLDGVVAACATAGVACRFVLRETDLDPRVVLGSGAG